MNKENSRDSNEFVRSAYPIIIAETYIHGGKIYLMPMIGSPTKARGVYRLLRNGGWKRGCAVSKTKGIRGRVLEQINEKIDVIAQRIHCIVQKLA